MRFTKFWLVWCERRGAPTFKHESFERAIAEAERLARQNPGEHFEVLERMSCVHTPDVIIEGELPLPF